MKVEVYADTACPWCYIGKARFEQALKAYAGGAEVEVHHRPFQLDASLPSEPSQAIPHNDYLAKRFGAGAASKVQEVVAVMQGLGLVFRPEAVQMANTIQAHRLAWFAEAQGGVALQAKVLEALYQAHFSEGLNLADLDVLASLAEAQGMGRAEALAFLMGEAGWEEVHQQMAEGRARNITGVPCFVFEDRWAVSGAQEVATFVQVLEEVAGARQQSALADAPGC